MSSLVYMKYLLLAKKRQEDFWQGQSPTNPRSTEGAAWGKMPVLAWRAPRWGEGILAQSALALCGRVAAKRRPSARCCETSLASFAFLFGSPTKQKFDSVENGDATCSRIQYLSTSLKVTQLLRRDEQAALCKHTAKEKRSAAWLAFFCCERRTKKICS